MGNKRCTILVLLLSLILSACGHKSQGTESVNPKNNPSQTEVAKLLAAEDTNIKQLYPEENKGESEKIDVWNYPDQDKQAFVRFDFSQIPRGAIVQKAVLKLYVYAVRNPGIIHFHAVHGQWHEYSLNYLNAGTLSLTHLFPHFVRSSDLNRYVEVDVTALVQSWVSGELANDGLSISADESNGDVRVDFHSRDALSNPSFLELTLN